MRIDYIDHLWDALVDAPDIPLWLFKIGPRGRLRIAVWGGPEAQTEDYALNEAAYRMRTLAPELLVPFSEVDEDEMDRYDGMTDSGFIKRVRVTKLLAGDRLYAQVFKASIDQILEEGGYSDEEIDRANEVAEELGLKVRWQAADF